MNSKNIEGGCAAAAAGAAGLAAANADNGAQARTAAQRIKERGSRGSIGMVSQCGTEDRSVGTNARGARPVAATYRNSPAPRHARCHRERRRLHVAGPRAMAWM
ncbi:hypothetical protein [Lysobacter capsici]|uniref:hypothetical protein n=1 Tax=Lysobacter capsici TaxID=435897 RepID=UPI001C0020EA|nr:hypothetical protein [Lysobacter capsici]QWF17413.1 hypothetical protein KME82_01005 [Lysobacter capsici]